MEILRERADARGGVIYFDVSDLDLEGYNKFVPYLFVSRRHVFGGRELFANARESFRGNESVEGSFGGSESRVAVREIWRRWAPACRGDFAGAR